MIKYLLTGLGLAFYFVAMSICALILIALDEIDKEPIK